jgi:hypothetical protein
MAVYQIQVKGASGSWKKFPRGHYIKRTQFHKKRLASSQFGRLKAKWPGSASDLRLVRYSKIRRSKVRRSR